MTDNGGGWIVLTTDRSRNYWSVSYDPTNNADKCSYDGISNQTNGSYIADGYVTQGACEVNETIQWRSANQDLDATQMASIQNTISELDSSSPLFYGDCDSDHYDPSWEAYSVAVDGSEIQLSQGASGNDQWNTGTYLNTSQIDVEYLLPASFRILEQKGCSNGGGIIAGYGATNILAR